MEVPDYGPYRGENWPELQTGLAAMIGRLHDAVGQLLDRLRQNGLSDNTVVLFSSDNGPHFEVGGNFEFFNSHRPLRGLKRDLTVGGIRVPFLVKWAGHVAAGSESGFFESFADFPPTQARIGSAKSVPVFDGLIFVNELTGRPDKQLPHDVLYREFYERGSARTVRLGNWKVIRHPLGGERFEVYDVASDVGETKNLADECPGFVAKGRRLMVAAPVPPPDWKVPAGKPLKQK
jgi:arylsulfatase A-like enzyme